MKNIFQSVIYSLIGLSTVAWISIVLIVISISNPGPDHAIVSFFDENIIVSEKIENFGFEGFAEVSESFFTRLYFDMNFYSFKVYVCKTNNNISFINKKYILFYKVFVTT